MESKTVKVTYAQSLVPNEVYEAETFINVKETYVSGGFFCVELNDGERHLYKAERVVRVREYPTNPK